MKRIILISILMMFISIFLTSGCMFEEARYQAAMQRRAEMIRYLQKTYPDTWQDKLFQYDMQQLQFDEQRRQNAASMFNLQQLR